MSWTDRARCADSDLPASTWFAGGETLEGRLRQRAALAECARCPVALECRKAADTMDEEYGIWGGEIRTPRHKREDAAA